MKKRENSQIVGLVLLFSLLSANLVSCRKDSGPRLLFDSVLPKFASTGQLITVSVYMNGQNDDGATGTVLIQADTACTVTLVNELGSCQVAFNSGGNRIITADYSGDSHNASERATYTYYVVAPLTPTPVTLTSLSISSDPNPSNPGESVEFKVRVGALPDVGTYPTGTVNISSSGETGCTATLSNGEGRCTTTLTTPGMKTITANYDGGGGWGGSRTSIDHEVSYATQVTLSIAPNPPVAGQPVQVTVTVSVVNGGAIPTGEVSIYYSNIGGCGYPRLVDGSATCQFVFAEAGEQTIHADYMPDEKDLLIYRLSNTSLQVNVRPAIIVQPTAKPTAVPTDEGGGGGTGCMDYSVDPGVCRVPCPDPNNFPEVCTLP